MMEDLFSAAEDVCHFIVLIQEHQVSVRAWGDCSLPALQAKRF